MLHSGANVADEVARSRKDVVIHLGLAARLATAAHALANGTGSAFQTRQPFLYRQSPPLLRLHVSDAPN